MSKLGNAMTSAIVYFVIWQVFQSARLNAYPITALMRLLRPEFKFSAKIETAFSQMLAIRS